MIAPSPSVSDPMDHTRKMSRSRSAHEIATTRWRCNGRKSVPLACRRRVNAISATSASVSLPASPCRRRRPSISGTVSISKARTGVTALLADPDAVGVLVVPAFGRPLDPALREGGADLALPFGMVVGPRDLAIERQAVLVVGG